MVSWARYFNCVLKRETIMTDANDTENLPDDAPSQHANKVLSPAAARALAEAKARRKSQLEQEAGIAPEKGGRGGKDPARYGDWEVKGIAVDF